MVERDDSLHAPVPRRLSMRYQIVPRLTMSCKAAGAFDETRGRRVFLPGKSPESVESALPPAPAGVDWVAVVSVALLTDDERKFFLLTRAGGSTAAEAARNLRWNVRRADAVRKRIGRKLARANLRPIVEPWLCHNSLQLGYPERVFGRKIWCLARLSPVFAEIMIAEKNNYLRSQQVASSFAGALSKRSRFADVVIEGNDTLQTGGSQGKFMAQDTDAFNKMVAVRTRLETKLRDARETLDKVLAAAKTTDATAQAIVTTTESLRVALQRDREEALLNFREPDTKIEQKLRDSETELEDIKLRQVEYIGVIKRQRTVVAGIEDEIANLRRSAFTNDIAEPQKRLNAALEEMLAASIQVIDVVNRHAEVSSGYALFPSKDPNDIDAHFSERMMALQVVNAAVRLDRYRNFAKIPDYRWTAT